MNDLAQKSAEKFAKKQITHILAKKRREICFFPIHTFTLKLLISNLILGTIVCTGIWSHILKENRGKDWGPCSAPTCSPILLVNHKEGQPLKILMPQIIVLFSYFHFHLQTLSDILLYIVITKYFKKTNWYFKTKKI